MEGKDHIIDEQLDAALKAYGAAEPRAGLEGRILANLRAERGRAVRPHWQWWPALVAVAVMLLMGAALVMRMHRQTSPFAVGNQPAVPAARESPKVREARVVAAAHPRSRANRAVASVPKLEQFPSPQPLSEQEEQLARYIERFPREAVLVARAQTQLMKQEMMEQELAPENAPSTDSHQENR
jgi:hypothetical protein